MNEKYQFSFKKPMETKTPISILALEHLTCSMRIIAKNYTKYDI